MAVRQYSNLFACLYDETEPVGHLGRGTHSSIFRCVERHDVEMKPASEALIHDFAVIWDEDHDVRLIAAIERMYMAGLLAPVQFIGERKGMLSVIYAARFWSYGDVSTYQQAVASIAGGLPFDSWAVEFGMFDRHQESVQTQVDCIINDTVPKVETYLRNLDNLWNLGTRRYQPRTDTLTRVADMVEWTPSLPLVTGAV